MLVINEPGLRSGSGSNPKVARTGSGGLVLVVARLEGFTGIVSVLVCGHRGRTALLRRRGEQWKQKILVHSRHPGAESYDSPPKPCASLQIYLQTGVKSQPPATVAGQM